MVKHLANDGKAQTASAKYGIPEEIEKHLPDTLLGKRPEKASKYVQLSVCKDIIFLAERVNKREVQIHLEQIISPIASKRPTGHLIPAAADDLLSYCDCLSISSFITGLSSQDLWPLTSAIHRLSILMLRTKLEACDFGLASLTTEMGKCARCPGDVAGKVARIREIALTAFEGLCLDCVKYPEKPPEQRLQCRVPHQRFRRLQRQLPVSEA